MAARKRTRFRRLADRGLSVLIVSHNLNDVFQVADRIAVLYLGHLVVQGPKEDFDNQSVVEYITTGKSDRKPAREVAS